MARWTKVNGAWGVEAPGGAPGDRVTVSRRDGRSATVTLDAPIGRGRGGTVWSTRRDGRSDGGAEGSAPAGYSLSRAFAARNDVGECPLCRQGFQAGESCLFLTGRMGAGGMLCPMTAEETRALQEAWRAAARAARAAGRERPATGEVAARVSFVLWEQMVHVTCSGQYGSPLGETTAEPGSRTVGRAHGTPSAGLQPSASTTVSLPTAGPGISAGLAENLAGETAGAAERARLAESTARETAERQASADWMPYMASRPDVVAERDAAVAARQTARETRAERETTRPAPATVASGPVINEMPKMSGVERFATLDLD